MNGSESTANVVGAFQKALAEVAGVTRSKTATVPMKAGGKFTYTYADLADVLATIKEASTKHGIAVSQQLRTEGSSLFCDTMIVHESGEWLIFPGMAMPADRDAQANGSAATYMRRYTLCAVFALEVEDDDGKAASQRPPAQKQKPVAPRRGSEAPPEEEPPPPPGDGDGFSATAHGIFNRIKNGSPEVREAVKVWAEGLDRSLALRALNDDPAWGADVLVFLAERERETESR